MRLGKLANRVARLEKRLRKTGWGRYEESARALNIEIESRVAGLRRLRARIAQQFNLTPLEDPFPDLSGEEYLVAHWRWFLANRRGRWPEWMGQLTASLIASFSVDMRVCCLRILYSTQACQIGVPRPGKLWLKATRGYLVRLLAYAQPHGRRSQQWTYS
jgi:hypothetical protein